MSRVIALIRLLLMLILLLLVLPIGMAKAANPPETIDNFDEIVHDDDDDLTGENERKLDLLFASFDNGISQQRQTAIWQARIQTESVRVIEKLGQIVAKEPPEVATTAAATLGEIGRKEAVPALISALDHKSEMVREAAAYALGKIGSEVAREPLKKHLPAEPGLSRWIYQEALDRIDKVPPAPNPHRTTFRGAGVFFLGGEGKMLEADWANFIARYNLHVYGAAPFPLNPVMGKFGGPPKLDEFYRLLHDKDDKPQIDLIMISGLLGYEFPPELQWKLYQFVRRGGVLLAVGNSMYLTSTINNADGTPRFKFSMPNALWFSCLPPTLDAKFRPCLANVKKDFRTTVRGGVRQFGNGRTMVLAYSQTDKPKITDLMAAPWGDYAFGKVWINQLNPELLLPYAYESDAAFPVLLDLSDAPAKVTGAGPARFSTRCFSLSKEDGILKLNLRQGDRTFVKQEMRVEMNGAPSQPVGVDFALPRSLPDGAYTVELAFATAAGSYATRWPLTITSPLRMQWSMQNSYRDAGGTLTGSLSVANDAAEPFQQVEVRLDVVDGKRRTLQRYRMPVTLNPGQNGPFDLKLAARDLPIGSYYLTTTLVEGEQILQHSERRLLRCGPYHFQQDLVYAPWGGAQPDDDRGWKAMKEFGFNAFLNGKTTYSLPGWYSWSVWAPSISSKPTWPGDWIEGVSMGGTDEPLQQGAQHIHTENPTFTTIHHWDETENTIVYDVRGDVAPTSAILYRNWLKSRYFTLDALSAAWRKDYHFYRSSGRWERSDQEEARIWRNPSKKIPPAQPWDGDLTSWDQIWPYRGSSADWTYYVDTLWTDYLYQCRNQYRRYDRDHWWIWYDLFHTRLETGGVRPNVLNFRTHQTRATLGNRPSTIMPHYLYYPPKSPQIARYLHWETLLGGGRHFIIYLADRDPAGDAGCIWNPDYSLTPHGEAFRDSIRYIRPKEQVLLDSAVALSKQVAFLYYGGPSWPPGSNTPPALFDALLFGGIHPDAIEAGTASNPQRAPLRSERMSLDTFRVIIDCGKEEMSPEWKARIAAWQQKGGVLIPADELAFNYEGDRADAPGFNAYQQKVLARMKQCGVTPPIQVVDDNGLPEPMVNAVLQETEDQSQRYVTLASDWDIVFSQAFGKLDAHTYGDKIELRDGWQAGAKFRAKGGSGIYRVWAEVKHDGPFSAKVTIDGTTGLPFPHETQESVARLWAERGAGKAHWLAGPGFKLTAGEHTLKIGPQDGKAEILRVLIVDDSLINPTFTCTLPGVQEVYDVYHDRILPKTAGGWPLTLGLSEMNVYSLITESLGALQIEPRLLISETDRQLQLNIRIPKEDKTLSDCRHALNITVRDAKGNEIEGIRAKTSVRGWRIVTLFPALEDPALPWTVEVKDLTSGRSATVTVTAPAKEAFTPPYSWEAPIELRTEPLSPMDGDVNILPFTATVVNRRAVPLKGTLRIELPRELLLEGQTDTMPVEVKPNGTANFSWTAVLNRKQAIYLTEHQPRIWLTPADGKMMESSFEDVWIREWEKTPPLVTNLRQSTVSVAVNNYTDKPVAGVLTMGVGKNWEILGGLPSKISLAAFADDKPGTENLTFQARLKPFAPQAPEVYGMPLSLKLGNKTYGAGVKLVEAVKRRTWHVIDGELVLSQTDKDFVPEIPATALNAKNAQLWNAEEWRDFESDTLIDFPITGFPQCFAVTNVRFAQAGEVSVRVRGDSKVKVWLGGKALNPWRTDRNKRKPLDPFDQDQLAVPANTWLPLVVFYERSEEPPSTDLVFLDKNDSIIWSTEFRAVPEEDK